MNNRPIKFRAWNGKKMVGVSELVFFNNGRYKINDDVESQYDGWTLMQFTGLTDKNAKLIYEGDIIKYQRHGSMGWVIQDPEIIEDIRHCNHLMDDTIKDMEVMGNIYEHSHLIK